MAKSKHARASARPRRPRFRATNPHDPRLLTAIWRPLDRKNREQLMTAAFGMLREQVGDVVGGRFPDGAPLPRALLKVLFRSNARAPLDKVMLCGTSKTLDFANDLRKRAVGRWQRPMKWLRNGNLIAPDWRPVRSSRLLKIATHASQYDQRG